MINEKNFNLEQVAAPTIGTANAQDTAKNAPAYSERTLNPKLFTSFKICRKLRIMIIEAELLIMEKYNSYSKGMNKELTQNDFKYYLDKTPYRNLKTKGKKANIDAPCPLIFRAATSCLYLCVKVKRDEMHSNLFGRNICECEHTFKKESDADDFRVEFSNSISGFTKTHYEYLKELYPDAKNNAEMAKLAFSDVLMFAARFTGKFDTHLSSAGSKKWAMHFFRLDMINFVEEQKKVLVDVFSRTASTAFAGMGIFDEIYCGDKDKRFVNFFEVLRDYPVALILRLKSICTNFMNELLGLWFLEGEMRNFCNAFYAEITKRMDKNLHKASLTVKIDAAVCLLLKFRFSFSGYGKDFNFEQVGKFIDGLDTVCNDLLYTSMVLTDRKNSRRIHKGIYKKTAGGLAYQLVNETSANTVSICPITYEHWSFMKPILNNRNNPNAVIELDPPYLRSLMLPCGDYKHEFTEKHMRRMFRLFNGAKCKAILFHSADKDFESMAVYYGFRLVGTYKKDKNSTETTQVYSLNISPKEKFFDPKNHGELY